MDFLINPDLENDEEHRIYYVGLSRAIDRLFIVVPGVQKKHQKLILEKYKIVIEELSKAPELV